MGTPCSFCNLSENANHLFLVVIWPKLFGGLLARLVVLLFVQKLCGGVLLRCLLTCLGGNKFYKLVVAAICWGVWTGRNKITFNNHVVRSPVSVIFTICSFLLYWSHLLKDSDKEALRQGVQVLMNEISRIASSLASASALGVG